jgi:DNA processing protein
LDEARSERRLRWIGWSLRHDLRPSVLADAVRLRDGDPPPLPLSPAFLPVGLELRPSDRAFLTAPAPGMDDARAALQAAEAEGIAFLSPDDGGWVARFWDEMTDPPCGIYVRGRLHEPDEAAVAVVGSRHASTNGLAIARSLARELALEGVTVVSGLALGIDGAAHRGTLEAGGRTVAVLGGGVDQPSPPSHAALAGRIAASGALVSEFPLGCHPRPLHFPRRNRILAALAQVIVIVEGGTRSGARSTVDHAAAIGREIAAVPRDPVHEGSELPNALIQAGATPVVRARDILEMLALSHPTLRRNPTAPEEDDVQRIDAAILERLGPGKRTVDGLIRSVGCSQGELLAGLGRLEASGRVRRLPGMGYERTGSRV